MGGRGVSVPASSNEAVLRRVYEQGIVKGNLSVLDESLDRNFVDHEPLPPGFKPGVEGVKQLFTALRTGFPDLQVTMNDVANQGDKVWARATFTGTHKGTFLNIPPTNKKVSFELIDILRFSGGRVAEHWGVIDNLGMLQQLGAVPPPGQPPKK